MRLAIDVNMTYRLGMERTVLLEVEAARTKGQTVTFDALDIEDATLDRTEGACGVGRRIWAHVRGEKMRLRYRADVDVTRETHDLRTLSAAPLHALPSEALTFIRPSRYCQSDMFAAFAFSRFGHLSGGTKVAAIRDWIEDEMAYSAVGAHPGITVLDTFARREGVCRDYAHMVCALVRAAGIPARYASAYGINVEPPDFHAVAQVWLGGAWHLVDATGMCRPDEMAIIAVGRDAGDTPFMETQDFAWFESQRVSVSAAPAVPR